MKSFKGLKSLFCLMLTFIFMFGNVLFVKAAVVIEGKEKKGLGLEYKDIWFTGTIEYTCSDPYGDKKIIKVDNISLDKEAYSWVYDKVVFEQQGVNFIDITGNGTMVTAYVNGILKLYPYQADEGADEDTQCYVEYVNIPVNYNLKS